MEKQKQNLLNLGYIDDYMAFLAKIEHTGVVYADPGLAIHIQKNHSHELPREILEDPFKYAREILNGPDYIGKHPGHGGAEIVKYFGQEKINLMIGIKLDPRLDYLYIATLHPIEDYKINKRLNTRLFKYSENPIIAAQREAAAATNTEKEITSMDGIKKALEKDVVLQESPIECIREQYKEQYPAIRHISEKSASIIDNMNKQHGSILSIDEINEMYKAAGKRVEGNYSKSDMEEFKNLKEVVDDLKKALLTQRQEQAQENAAHSQVKINDKEIVQ